MSNLSVQRAHRVAYAPDATQADPSQADSSILNSAQTDAASDETDQEALKTSDDSTPVTSSTNGSSMFDTSVFETGEKSPDAAANPNWYADATKMAPQTASSGPVDKSAISPTGQIKTDLDSLYRKPKQGSSAPEDRFDLDSKGFLSLLKLNPTRAEQVLENDPHMIAAMGGGLSAQKQLNKGELKPYLTATSIQAMQQQYSKDLASGKIDKNTDFGTYIMENVSSMARCDQEVAQNLGNDLKQCSPDDNTDGQDESDTDG